MCVLVEVGRPEDVWRMFHVKLSDGHVIGVRIDSNDDSGFWLQIPYPKTSQPKETDVNKDDKKKRKRDGDEPQSKEEDEE